MWGCLYGQISISLCDGIWAGMVMCGGMDSISCSFSASCVLKFTCNIASIDI